MVEATDFTNRDDPTELRRLNWPAVGRILFERQVSARSVVVREVASQGTAQVLFAKDDDVFRHSRRMEPMSRSAKGFCHGLWGAVRTSPTALPLRRCRNT